MISKHPQSRLADAIQRYRVASFRFLATEFPGLQLNESSLSMQLGNSFRSFEALGQLLVTDNRYKLGDIKSIVRSVAAQEFFCSDENYSMLTKDDVAKFFPSLFRNGLPRGYFVDSRDSVPKLGLLRIDCNWIDVYRIYQKTRQQIQKHQKYRDFARLISENQFEITWLVPTQSKSNAVRLLDRQKNISCNMEALRSQTLFDAAFNNLASIASPMSRV